MADDQPTIGSWAISSLEEGMEKKEHAFLMETWREYKEGIRQREGQPPQPRPLAEIQYYENTAPELLPLKEFLRSEIKLVGFLNAKTPFAKLMNSFICNHRGLWNVLHGDAVRVQPPDEQLPVGGLVGGPGPNPASGVPGPSVPLEDPQAQPFPHTDIDPLEALPELTEEDLESLERLGASLPPIS